MDGSHPAASPPRGAGVSRSQRWRERRALFVPDQTLIDPREFGAEVIPDRQAKAFTTVHHYSGAHPVARLSVGLFRKSGLEPLRLVGVATFAVPINDRSVPLHTGLDDPRAAVDLGRFVLLDEVAGNGETWFLSRAFRMLRRERPGIDAVIAYSDPVPRRGVDGRLVLPGHVGGIYRDFGRGVAYRGRGSRRIEHLTPDGRPFSSRAASKIRSGETGHAYAVDELVRRGAPPPSGADLRAWYDGLLASGFLTRRRHPGNHVYAFPLTRTAKRAGQALPRAPFPVLDRSGTPGDVTALPLLAPGPGALVIDTRVAGKGRAGPGDPAWSGATPTPETVP